MLMVKATLLVPLFATIVAAQSVPHRKQISTLAKEVNGAVVSIVVSDKDGHAVGEGSGFVISKDGNVVTNYHVIKGARSAVVKIPNGAFFLVDGVLATDEERDIALIKAHGNNFLKLALGDSDRVKVGEEVVAIGSPLSLESTVSNGIVSGIRELENQGGELLQITAPISPGSSGGPLFNMSGEVIGITSSHLARGENLNFAVPIKYLRKLLLTKSSDPSPLTGEIQQNEKSPGLEEALVVMNRMVEPEQHHITLTRAGCSLSIKSDEPYRLALPVSTYEKNKDEYGIIHYGFKFDIFQEPKSVAFELGDIDPDSIKLKDVASPEFVAANDVDGHPELLKHPDLTSVWFTTRDLKRSILDWENNKTGGTFIIFRSEDRAQRFVAAFIYSVRSCGGRPSEFVPTESH